MFHLFNCHSTQTILLHRKVPGGMDWQKIARELFNVTAELKVSVCNIEAEGIFWQKINTK